jgi:hypothetical protein
MFSLVAKPSKARCRDNMRRVAFAVFLSLLTFPLLEGAVRNAAGMENKMVPMITMYMPEKNDMSFTSNKTSAIRIQGGVLDDDSRVELANERILNTDYLSALPASISESPMWAYHNLSTSGENEIISNATYDAGIVQRDVIPSRLHSQFIIPGGASTSSHFQPLDRFGIAKLYPSAANGIEWSSSWNDGNPRQFGNEVDPYDKWFDTDHGKGTYVIDGNGTLTASGDYVRMYVHDPANMREWSENLEITVYVNRINETQFVDYAGPEIFARTNHGTNADENQNLCDDRGYGGVVLDNGKWAFVKEIAHHLPNGYVEAAAKKPWAELPKNTPVGVKFILRNMDSDSKVKLELYRDMTGGLNGGKWEKITEFVDNGTNFGVGGEGCKPFVNPALQLIHPYVYASSETKKPMLSVYIRSEFATMEFSKFTIREITPLP